MENIVLGLLKSNHPVKFKKNIIEKLIQANTSKPSPNYTFKKLLNDIELIWSIGIETASNESSTYETLLAHYDTLKSVFNYFLLFENTEANIQELITHLVNLIKLVLVPNLNKESNHVRMRKNYLVMLAWLRLVNECYLAHLTNFELCSNFVNLLTTLNSNLNQSPSAQTFFYFIQNDSLFCKEYINFVKSFLILADKYAQANTTNNDRIVEFLEKSILNTICLLIRHVIAHKIQLDVPEQYRSNIKIELENLCECEKLIQLFVSKSPRLHEHTIREILNFLCDANTDEQHLDKKLAQLFRTFDLTRNLAVIYRYFEENRAALAQSENDVYLKNLLFNLISLVSWPFGHKIDEWICAIMTILAVKYQKFQLLISVSEQKCDYILNLLNQKNINESALNIFSFFLINYKHSPKLFHKIFSKVCDLLENLKFRKLEEHDTKAASVYNQVAVLAFICMTRFNGYPQIYRPLLEVVQTDAELSGYEIISDKYSIEKIAESLKSLSSEIESKETNRFSAPASTSFSSLKESEADLVEEYQSIKKLGPYLTGLVNLGNTCYLNSIIQSLFSCKKFVKSLVETEIQQLSEPSNDYSFLNQLRILFSIMLLTQRPAIKATNFVKHCTPTWFKCGQQQDSSEFLTFLLDNLNEQLKKFDTNMLNLVKKSFGIQLKTQCKCSNCNTVTSRDDVSFYLPLSFSSHTSLTAANQQTTVSTTPTAQPSSADQHKKMIPLQSLISHFFEVEHLSSETGNSYFCSSCNSLQNASKQIFLTRNEEKSIHPPDYLIFTLNRFIYQINGTVQTNLKIMDIVDYPTRIDINTYTENNILISETYSLLAIVVHSGSSLHYGHYYTYMVSESNESNWYLANDSQITQVSFESLSSNQNLFKDDTPYLLFYARVTTTTTTTDLSQIKVPSKKLIEIIEQDNKIYQVEEKNRVQKSKKPSQIGDKYSEQNKAFYSSKDDDDDPSGSSGGTPPDHCNNDSTRDSGPRIVF